MDFGVVPTCSVFFFDHTEHPARTDCLHGPLTREGVKIVRGKAAA